MGGVRTFSLDYRMIDLLPQWPASREQTQWI